MSRWKMREGVPSDGKKRQTTPRGWGRDLSEDETCLRGNECECDTQNQDIHALAATDGNTKAVLIANMTEDKIIETNLDGFDVYLVDENHNLEKIDVDSKKFELLENQVVLLKKQFTISI